MKGIFVAAALYFALSWATYKGTISPKKAPVVGSRDYATYGDQLIYGSRD